MKNFLSYFSLLFIILIQITLADSLLLNKKINYFFNRNPELKSSQIGVLVKSGGKTIYAKKENLSLIPASNLKIITSACAFFYLGENFRYQTKLLSSPIDTVFKTIKGNLVLK
ncbi:MAG: D-alanyl-D-alanine carboxypeptidase, partial [Armatimonadetes bacterium]|nr:D-alanyl-D-alanine carboxypeptidase [Armatimonadota bacterium]